MSKYLYTATDIGIYFNNADLPHSKENKILEQLWEDRHKILDLKYRKNRAFFCKSVRKEMEKYLLETNNCEIDSINKILEDIGSSFTLDTSFNEEYQVEAFFRVIKLKLIYTDDINNIKMKLRTLLGYFGYRRRSQQFVDNVKRTLKALGLITYLKAYELCDVSMIKLDDMIMIRLK